MGKEDIRISVIIDKVILGDKTELVPVSVNGISECHANLLVEKSKAGNLGKVIAMLLPV
jgi:hypothetical protein